MTDEILFVNFSHKLPSHIAGRIKLSDHCWNFDGDPSSNGYMRCWFKGSRHMAHRLIYELATGRDIRKKQLDHLCTNRACCNPNHMDPVTAKVNCLRRTKRRKSV